MIGFDLVRAAAAISVIWIHAGHSATWHELHLPEIGRWGTSFLNMLAAFFLVVTLKKYLISTPGPLGATKFLGHRLFRIGTPFVLWSLIYAAARVVNYALFGKITTLKFAPLLLEHGTTYHLWFLPYLMLISVLALPIVYWAIGSAVRERTLAVVALVFGLVVTVFWAEPSWVPNDPERLTWIFRTLYIRCAAFSFGLAFGLLHVSNIKLRVPVSLGLTGGVIAVCAAGCAAITSTGPTTDFTWTRIAALGAFLMALLPWRGVFAESAAKLGSLGFGVYLCHVLFVEFAHSFASALKIPPSLTVDGAVFVFAVVASFSFAAMMRKTKLLSWLIP